jgi:hypothetical protein
MKKLLPLLMGKKKKSATPLVHGSGVFVPTKRKVKRHGIGLGKATGFSLRSIEMKTLSIAD